MEAKECLLLLIDIAVIEVSKEKIVLTGISTRINCEGNSVAYKADNYYRLGLMKCN